MPKKILYESAIHHLLMAARRFTSHEKFDQRAQSRVVDMIDSFTFGSETPGQLTVKWSTPQIGQFEIALKPAKFYYRGDSPSAVETQKVAGLLFHDDEIKNMNDHYFDHEFTKILVQAGLV